MRSIEVLGCMVAFALVGNNPYFGQDHLYRGPVARVQREGASRVSGSPEPRSSAAS